jgi:ABC-type branched-subunit amino acid transport system substrate-binding protein
MDRKKLVTLIVSISLILIFALSFVPACSSSSTPSTTTSGPATTNAVTSQASSKTFPSVFTFGTLQSITGAGAYWGKVEMQGQNLAIAQINASGVLPFKLQILVGDNVSDDPTAGLAAARKLIDVDHMHFSTADS